MPFRKVLEHNMIECKYLLSETFRSPHQDISLIRLIICYDPDFIMGKPEKQKEKRITIYQKINIDIVSYAKLKMQNGKY